MNDENNILNEQDLNQLYSQYQDCNLTTSQVLSARSSLIGKDYLIIDIIAGNKTSLVFKCINIDTKQQVAIKSQICRNQTILRQFQSQFEILQSQQHPNLLRVHQIFYDQTTEFIFIVMDLCINGDLYYFQKQNMELPRETMIDVCQQILKSIIALHSYGIVHGDINPSNFLIDSSFTTKISYQGSSKFLYNTLKHAFTDPFTFHFTSKSQLESQNPSPQSDLFSTGVVLLDLLGLNLDENLDIAIKLKNFTIQQLSNLKEKIPNKFQDLFDIFIELIQQDSLAETTEQSIQIMNKIILKTINLPRIVNLIKQNNELSQSQIQKQVKQTLTGIDQTLVQKYETKTSNLQLKKRIVSSFYNFICKTNKKCWTFIFFNFKKIILQTLFFILKLLYLLKNEACSFIFHTKSKFKQKIEIQKEDKSIQTIQQFDDSLNITPIYKNKFFNHKQVWNDCIYNKPFENEMTTQYLDSEEMSQEEGNNSIINKIEFDRLLSDDSILSTENFENSGETRSRSNTESKLDLLSQNQLSSENNKYTGQKRLSNASTNFSSSDSQTEDIQRDKQNSIFTQKIISSPFNCNIKSPLSQTQQDILFYNNGYYIGEISNKKPQGEGKMYFHKGNRYEGQFQNGQYDGKGVYFYIGGNRYIGQWRNNLREGNGIFKWANGTKYIGEYQENIKQGKGNLKFTNGERYEGDFQNNCFHGNGKYYFSDGVIFEGQFEDGHRVSAGKFYLANGEQSNNSNYRTIPHHKKYQYKTSKQQDQI